MYRAGIIGQNLHLKIQWIERNVSLRKFNSNFN